jgi:hypothetical protein
MDPMTGQSGRAMIRAAAHGTDLYLQMEPGETRILRLFDSELVKVGYWPILKPRGEMLEIAGPWNIKFTEGGPFLPSSYRTEKLESWTNFNLPHVRSFAGAASYKITFDLGDLDADRLLLDLGDVRESARIWVNKHPAGVLVAHPFRLDISEWLKDGPNELTIEVTNLSANRIRDLDTRGIEWKKFHDINMVSHLYEPFDASEWPLKPSGLLGPVKLVPCILVEPDKILQ